jgi:hypothetical protein
MRKCRNLLIAGVAGATLLFGAPSALAAPKNVDIFTIDENPGGSAAFLPIPGFGFRLQACDIQPDGHGVRAYAGLRRGKKTEWTTVLDIDGYNGRCRSGSVGVAPGTPVSFSVCLRDHDGRDNPDGSRADQFCSEPVRVTT